jgi:hypothetical protein
LLPLSTIIAQLPSGIEKAFDEYIQEIIRVYRVIEKEEPSVALKQIDDMGYLRIDILGSTEDKESTVSFFVDNTGTGKQPWATDGHFMYELMDAEGDLLFTLWGSEDMGLFEITPVDGPGSLIKGLIQGTCSLDNGESEDKVRISAEFKAKYIESDY